MKNRTFLRTIFGGRQFTPRCFNNLESPFVTAYKAYVKKMKGIQTKLAKEKGENTKSYNGRMVWREAENNALLEGIKLHGRKSQRWKKIKEEFSDALSHRNFAQIKDRARTMTGHRLLDKMRQYLLDDFNAANPTVERN